jgi:hypothetical protein
VIRNRSVCSSKTAELEMDVLSSKIGQRESLEVSLVLEPALRSVIVPLKQLPAYRVLGSKSGVEARRA